MTMRKMITGIVASLAIVVLSFGGNASATTMEESVAFFDFNAGLVSGTQYAAGGGEVSEAAGTGGTTVNIAATTGALAYGASGAIGAMTPDGIGAYFAGGYVDFGTGAGNELDMAGSAGLSIVWRMTRDGGTAEGSKWGAGQALLSAMASGGTGGWADRQYMLALSDSGTYGVNVWVTIAGVCNLAFTIDMLSDFNMLQWATYALVYDDDANTLTLSAWGDDLDTYSSVKSITAGTIGAVTNSVTMQIGVDRNEDGTIGSLILRNTKIDGLAIFDKALTASEVEGLVVPEPVTLAVLLLGGSLTMFRRRRS